MTTDPPEPKPRRKWHFYKWLVLLITAIFAYGTWKAYAFRSAFKQAEALGWRVNYTKPLELIREDWKNAFKTPTWFDGVTWMLVPSGEELEKHRAMIQQLNPKSLSIANSQTLRDLSALKGHTRLKLLYIESASSLTNLDALQNLTALENIDIPDAQSLTNVDGLKNLLALKRIRLTNATKLTNVEALKNLPAVVYLELYYCTGLTNVDVLKNHKELQTVSLIECTGLTNVDGLKNLPDLGNVWLYGSTGITDESIEALKATLPNTNVFTDVPRLLPKPSEPNTTFEARDTDGQPVNTDTPPLAPKPIKPPPTNDESSPRL